MAIVKQYLRTIHLAGGKTEVNDSAVGATLPAVAITSNSLANPTVVTTPTPHGRVTGNIVTITGVITSVPSINGTYPIIVLSPTTFSIPVNVSTGGTGGSISTASVISPGMLIERYNSSGVSYWRPHSVVGGYSAIFALDVTMLNRGSGLPTGVVEDDYGITDLVEAAIAHKGSMFWALVATGAPAIVIGDKLESAGDGTLQKWTNGSPLALALEPMTNATGANARLRVEIL